MSHRRMAILEFDAGRLRDFLQLPETAEIVGVCLEHERRGRIQIRIEGAGWPVAEGEAIQRCTCTITDTRLEDGTQLKPQIDWPFADQPLFDQEI